MEILLCCMTATVESLPWWVGFLLDIAATIIALFVTYAFLHPRIRIYPMARIDVKTGKIVFLIKNMGLLPIYNLKLELIALQRDDSGELIEVHHELDGGARSILYGIFHPMEERTLQDCSSQNIQNCFNDVFWKTQWLQLQVTASHRISNVVIVETCDFHKEDIQVGSFLNGELYSIQKKKIISIPILLKKLSFFYKWLEIGLLVSMGSTVLINVLLGNELRPVILGCIMVFIFLHVLLAIGTILYLTIQLLKINRRGLNY